VSEKAFVSLCVCTYKRPKELRRLLKSLNGLTFLKNNIPEIEIIVVDNEPSEVTQGICDAIALETPWPIRYIVENERGISQARNKAIASVSPRTEFIAFIDDDEEATPTWLDELLFVQREYNADVVKGITIRTFDSCASAEFVRYFPQQKHLLTGTPYHEAYTNNVLICAKVFKEINFLFDKKDSQIGGGDVQFFRKLHRLGYRIIHAGEAVVYERFLKERTNMKWLAVRYFRGGSLRVSYQKNTSKHVVRFFFKKTIEGFILVAKGSLHLLCDVFKKRSKTGSVLEVFQGLGTLSGAFGFHYPIYATNHQSRGWFWEKGFKFFLKAEKTITKTFFPYRNKTIAIETSSMCNARCVWCWMYFSEKKDIGIMDFENFKKIINLNRSFFIKNKIKIIPYHRGEPLLHPDFFEMVRYADEAGINVGDVHTNLSCHIDMKKLASCPVSRIFVNIGGTDRGTHERIMRGSDYDLVCQNLREIFDLTKNNPERVLVKMNVTKDNFHQRKDLPKLIARLGGDPMQARISPTGFCVPSEATAEEREEFFKNVVSDEMKDYLRFTYDEKKRIEPKKKECAFLLPTVKWDGKVTICCHDQLSRLNLGNAFGKPLKEIFESKIYKENEKMGKKREHNMCHGCN